MIKKTPFNYSNDMDRRRQGLDAIVENLLPDVTSEDAGKIMKIDESGKWILADDENTIIEANPEEGTASEELQNLKIGSTIYSVNKPSFEYIKGIRLTISAGGEFRTDKPKVEFYDDAGNLVTTPTYTSSCDKEYQGNIALNQVCSIATTDAPGAFTYVFDSNMAVTINHLIKLTNAGSFAGDIAKSVKVELTSDGENWIELWFDPSIAWSGSANAYRIIDIKTGEVSSTILPIVTTSDNTTILQVSNGTWNKGVKLPVPTSGDNGKAVMVNSSGNFELKSVGSDTPKLISVLIAVMATGSKDTSGTDYDVIDIPYRIAKFTVDGVDMTTDFNNNNVSIHVDENTIIKLFINYGLIFMVRPNVNTNTITGKENIHTICSKLPFILNYEANSTYLPGLGSTFLKNAYIDPASTTSNLRIKATK